MTDVEYWLEVRTGVLESAEDARVLDTLARTAVGLVEHGFITELVTTGNGDRTRWAWRAKDAGYLEGMVETAHQLAPDYWRISWSAVLPDGWTTSPPGDMLGGYIHGGRRE